MAPTFPKAASFREGGEGVYMPYRRDAFVADHVYHVYNRGVNKMPIFVKSDNYVYLLRKVKRLRDELPVTVLAYCLMPNHYHFVLRQDGDTSLSVFIQRLFQTYTQAFNKQQGRRGPLFEGRFRHVHVDRDAYVLHLCRYVHLNPAQAGLVSDPGEWPYSNYLEWIDARPGTLVERSFVQQFFSTRDDYIAFVQAQVTPGLARELRPYLLDDEAYLPES